MKFHLAKTCGLLLSVLSLICDFAVCAAPAQLATARKLEVIDVTTSPHPYAKGKPEFSCTFAPDYVGSDVPRRLYMELQIPALDYPEFKLAYDETKIKLLGQRSLETSFNFKGEKLATPIKVRRFYFETIHDARGKTEVVFPHGNDAVAVPLIIWNYEDLRRPKLVNGIEFPRRYPMGGRVEKLKPPVTNAPKVGGQNPWPMSFEGRAKNNDSFDPVNFTMEEVWGLTPDAGMTSRVGIGPLDPIHGAKVTSVGGGFCPYKQLLGKPGAADQWYMVSPVDGRKIPDNDLAKGDYTSGKWIDDGFNGMEVNGTLCRFIANHHWYRGPYVYHLADNLALNYLRTGNAKYLELALVDLCRIGVEHNFMSMMPNHRRTHANTGWNMRLTDAVPMTVLGNPGFFIHGCGQPNLNYTAVNAYAKIFPYIEQSKDAIKFMQAKGFPISTHDDLKRFIEENVIHTAMQSTTDGTCTTNMPGPQKFFLGIVKALDYPTTELVDIAKDGDGTYFINGIMKPLMYNSLCRDGVNYESPGGYNGGKWADVLEMAKTYREIIQSHPDIFPAEKYLVDVLGPKLAVGMEAMIEHHPTRTSRLCLGDAGSMPVYGGTASQGEKIIPKSMKINFFGDENANTFAEAYKIYPTAKIAWALVNSGWTPPKDYPCTLEQLKQNAATLPENWRSRGRLLSGLGISLNRSGLGNDERCLTIVYGNSSYPGHEHDSTMGLFLDAFGNSLITSWGYPPNWDSWYRSWVTQNTGRQFPPGKGKLSGMNEINLDSGPIHVTDSYAEALVDQGEQAMATAKPRYEIIKDSWQRRMNILVDVSDKDFYILDLYRIMGGTEHWRSMQTLDGAVSVEGLDLRRQDGGTLAGKDVAYDDKAWWSKRYGDRLSRPFTLLENVETAMASASPWSVIWNIKNSDGLKMALTGLYSDGAEINLADARDAQRSHDVVRRFVMTHHKAQDKQPLKSVTLNAIQAYRGDPVIKAVTCLAVDGQDERGFAPLGCWVRLASRIDCFILSASESAKTMKLPNGKTISLEGRIGYVALNIDGSLKDMRLIAGRKLSYDGQVISHDVGIHRAQIVKTDYKNWSFEIAPACKTPAELVGKHIYINRGGMKIGMEMRAAQNVGNVTRIKVNCDPLLLVGTSRIFEDNWLKYRTGKNSGTRSDAANLSAYRTYYNTVIIGKSGTQYTIDNIGLDGIKMAPTANCPTDKSTLEKEFPVGADLKAYDYGVGNTVEIPLNAAWK